MPGSVRSGSRHGAGVGFVVVVTGEGATGSGALGGAGVGNAVDCSMLALTAATGSVTGGFGSEQSGTPASAVRDRWLASHAALPASCLATHGELRGSARLRLRIASSFAWILASSIASSVCGLEASALAGTARSVSMAPPRVLRRGAGRPVASVRRGVFGLGSATLGRNPPTRP